MTEWLAIMPVATLLLASCGVLAQLMERGSKLARLEAADCDEVSQ